MSITDSIRSLVTAADKQLTARGFSCSATFASAARVVEIDEAEKRLGGRLPKSLRDVYRETGEIVVAIVEIASGRAFSVISLDSLVHVVEQTEFIRGCLKRNDPAIVFVNFYDGLHAGITPDGHIVEVDEEYLGRPEFPVVASSLDEFFSHLFECAATRAVWSYWLPE